MEAVALKRAVLPALRRQLAETQSLSSRAGCYRLLSRFKHTFIHGWYSTTTNICLSQNASKCLFPLKQNKIIVSTYNDARSPVRRCKSSRLLSKIGLVHLSSVRKQRSLCLKTTGLFFRNFLSNVSSIVWNKIPVACYDTFVFNKTVLFGNDLFLSLEILAQPFKVSQRWLIASSFLPSYILFGVYKFFNRSDHRLTCTSCSC